MVRHGELSPHEEYVSQQLFVIIHSRASRSHEGKEREREVGGGGGRGEGREGGKG